MIEKEIVVASYNENLNWLRHINNNWKITIYNTYEKAKNFPPNINVIKLPNKGREASQWLNHIINNYNNIAKFTIFLQGDGKHQLGAIKELVETHILPDNNFGYVGSENIELKDFISTSHFNKTDILNLLKAGWGVCPIPKPIKFKHGGQFYVKSQVIKNRPIEHYKKILDYIYNFNGIDPAYILEMNWSSVFNRNL